MSSPKRQHTISKFYLENFINQKNKLTVYDKENKKFIDSVPSNTTIEKHFYSFKNENGSWNYAVENRLSMLESHAAPVINNLIQDINANLSPQNKNALLAFICFLIVRTTKYKEIIKNHTPPDKWKEFGLKETDENLKEITLAAMEGSAMRIKTVIETMPWKIYKLPMNRSLITSDAPFTTLDIKLRIVGTAEQIIGIDGPNTINFIPLSKKHCLVISRIGVAPVLDGRLVRKINLAIFHAANRFVIASSKKLLKKFVDHHILS